MRKREKSATSVLGMRDYISYKLFMYSYLKTCIRFGVISEQDYLLYTGFAVKPNGLLENTEWLMGGEVGVDEETIDSFNGYNYKIDLWDMNFSKFNLSFEEAEDYYTELQAEPELMFESDSSLCRTFFNFSRLCGSLMKTLKLSNDAYLTDYEDGQNLRDCGSLEEEFYQNYINHLSYGTNTEGRLSKCIMDCLVRYHLGKNIYKRVEGKFDSNILEQVTLRYLSLLGELFFDDTSKTCHVLSISHPSMMGIYKYLENMKDESEFYQISYNIINRCVSFFECQTNAGLYTNLYTDGSAVIFTVSLLDEYIELVDVILGQLVLVVDIVSRIIPKDWVDMYVERIRAKNAAPGYIPLLK